MRLQSHATTTLLFLSLAILPFQTLARTLILEEVKTDEGCKVIDFHDTSKADSKKMVSASWSGSCKDGYTDGPGSLTAINGEGTKDLMNGTMVKGKFEGEVSTTVSRRDGTSTTARVTFLSGLPNGNGSVETINADGQKLIYSGAFKDGLPDGDGKIISPAMTVVGKFSEGKPSGVMTLTPNHGKWVYEGKLSFPRNFVCQG